MDRAWDELALESIADLHGIETRPFIPFAIARLASDPVTMEARLAVELRGLRDADSIEHRRLRLTWAPDSVPRLPPGMQENPVTEWAAVAVACAVVWPYAGLRIHRVAEWGSSFDYWVRGAAGRLALEVSGTTTDDVAGRHREKVRQLRGNPYCVGGYVIVVGFGTRQVTFSRHEAEGGTP